MVTLYFWSSGPWFSNKDLRLPLPKSSEGDGLAPNDRWSQLHPLFLTSTFSPYCIFYSPVSYCFSHSNALTVGGREGRRERANERRVDEFH